MRTPSIFRTLALGSTYFRKENHMSCTSAFWWDLLKRVGAVYECPINAAGIRTGPLVGYAGKDEEQRAFVGDVYVNLAVLERNADYLGSTANCLIGDYSPLRDVDVFCGAPEGGKSLALLLASKRGGLYCYPDQEVLAGTREKQLTFMRHDGCMQGKRVAIVEDVLNNFSTTQALVDLIKEQGGTVTAIVAVLDRSNTQDNSWNSIPIYPIIRKSIPQYRQSDEQVKDDIAKGNVVFRPKTQWDHLIKIMNGT